MRNQLINHKTTALLALEAKMIEKNTEVYNLENYIPEMFSEIESILSSEKPERLLDSIELKTFHSLIHEHTGGERRKRRDRRIDTQADFNNDRRTGDRRWYGIQSSRPGHLS
ncbi:MAG: hypothetical protein ACE5GK_07980 [Nitrospiria bacterium]